jgi:hypothetical protein
MGTASGLQWDDLLVCPLRRPLASLAPLGNQPKKGAGRSRQRALGRPSRVTIFSLSTRRYRHPTCSYLLARGLVCRRHVSREGRACKGKCSGLNPIRSLRGLSKSDSLLRRRIGGGNGYFVLAERRSLGSDRTALTEEPARRSACDQRHVLSGSKSSQLWSRGDGLMRRLQSTPPMSRRTDLPMAVKRAMAQAIGL